VSDPGGDSSAGSSPRPRPSELPKPPSLRERLGRRPLGSETWAGLILLGFYAAVAISAILVFGSSLDAVPSNVYWVPPPPIFRATLGPSMAHPFGVLPGLGTDLFQAVWKATPYDLAIVTAILLFDVALGWTLGALAGMTEGSYLDSVIRFVGDTFGAVPSFFWVIALFAGFATVAPGSVNLTVFVLVFGFVIWPTTARTTRERARTVAREPFLEAAKAAGASPTYRYFRHILPNSTGPLLAQIPVDIAPIFFVLTALPWFWDCALSTNHSGSPIPVPYMVPSLPTYSPLPTVSFPEWGNLLAVGTCEGFPISTAGPVFWWMFVPTLVAILGLGIATALLCDGLARRAARADLGVTVRRRRRRRPATGGIAGPAPTAGSPSRRSVPPDRGPDGPGP
jgi:ABC-type dipeptide/oligopeptide/nickel transport system permease subunit